MARNFFATIEVANLYDNKEIYLCKKFDTFPGHVALNETKLLYNFLI